MAFLTWVCVALVGIAALQESVTAQNISPRFAYRDEALQGRGSALSTGYGPGNASPNDYAETGRRESGDTQTTNEPSFLGNLARRGWNLINRGVQTAVGIGRAGINLFRNRVPPASQVAAPNDQHGQRQTSDAGQGTIVIDGIPFTEEEYLKMKNSEPGEPPRHIPQGQINPNTLGNFHFRIG